MTLTAKPTSMMRSDRSAVERTSQLCRGDVREARAEGVDTTVSIQQVHRQRGAYRRRAPQPFGVGRVPTFAGKAPPDEWQDCRRSVGPLVITNRVRCPEQWKDS